MVSIEIGKKKFTQEVRSKNLVCLVEDLLEVIIQ